MIGQLQLDGIDPNGARFSECRRYRYELWRRWGDGPVLGWIGCNPSDAGEEDNDPSVRKMIGFSKRLGYGGLLLGNMSALVSTDWRGLLTASDPVGPENDEVLRRIASSTDRVVAAWGRVGGRFRTRIDQVLDVLAGVELWSFGVTKEGHPCHPLMLPYSMPLTRWRSTTFTEAIA